MDLLLLLERAGKVTIVYAWQIDVQSRSMVKWLAEEQVQSGAKRKWLAAKANSHQVWLAIDFLYFWRLTF